MFRCQARFQIQLEHPPPGILPAKHFSLVWAWSGGYSCECVGLAWDGKFFTIDNIQHWFDFRYYNFTINPVDFMAVAILRVCILLGGAVGVYSNPRAERRRVLATAT
uniref:Uncharacterized protein n=1 Tax=Ditylenchus dipsaci TaxID=166011 RepID=A0A915DYG5_9BILA